MHVAPQQSASLPLIPLQQLLHALGRLKLALKEARDTAGARISLSLSLALALALSL